MIGIKRTLFMVENELWTSIKDEINAWNKIVKVEIQISTHYKFTKSKPKKCIVKVWMI